MLKLRCSSYGIGDMVCGLYTVQALKNKFPEFTVQYCVRKPEWFHDVKDIEICSYAKSLEEPIAAIDIYVLLHHEKGLKSRKQQYSEKVPFLNLSPIAPTLKRQYVKGEYNSILLFPFSVWKEREWPSESWLYLENLLITAGFRTKIIIEHSRQKEAMHFNGEKIIGLSPMQVIDEMLTSKLVIGNDSGMVHIAGLYDIPTLAIISRHSHNHLYSHTKIKSVFDSQLKNIEIERVFSEAQKMLNHVSEFSWNSTPQITFRNSKNHSSLKDKESTSDDSENKKNQLLQGDKKFSLIIPTINQTTLVQQCVLSLKKHEPDFSSYEIIVIDDGSSPEIQNWLTQFAGREGLRLFLKPQNKGFSHSVNIGLRNSVAPYRILVNNDIVFIKPVLHAFESAFNVNPDIGIVGAKLVYPNYTIQHAGMVRDHHSFFHCNKHKERNDPDVSYSRYFLSVTGALFGIKATLINEIGYFNENYFIACEDAEYCLRAWVKNKRVYYSHEIEAIHAEGITRGNDNYSKSRKGHRWHLKEEESAKKFNQDIESIALDTLDMRVMSLNEDQAIISARKFSKKFRILVRRKGALGDVLLTTPIVRRLREQHGADVIINVATDSGIVYKNNPFIDEIYPHNVSIGGYDKVVDLDLVYEKNPEMHIIDAYSLSIFNDIHYNKSVVLQTSPEDKEFVIEKLDAYGINGDQFVVIHMGVTWKNRTWSEASWRTTCELIVALNIPIIVVGTDRDLLVPLPGVFDMRGCFSIHQIAVLISLSKCFIGNDSGILHVAGSTRTKIIGLFTSAKGEFRVPFRHGKYGYNCKIMKPEVSCYGCLHKQPVPVTSCECDRKDYICLEQIVPEMIVREVKKITRKKRRVPVKRIKILQEQM